MYTGVSKPEIIYVDPINRKVYYSDSMEGAIFSINMNGSGRKKVIGDITRARAFVLDYDGGCVSRVVMIRRKPPMMII